MIGCGYLFPNDLLTPLQGKGMSEDSAISWFRLLPLPTSLLGWIRLATSLLPTISSGYTARRRKGQEWKGLDLIPSCVWDSG